MRAFLILLSLVSRPAFGGGLLDVDLDRSRPRCFLDAPHALFDEFTHRSPACEQQRAERKLQSLAERTEWNQAGRHVLARVQPRINQYLRERGLRPSDAKNLVVGTSTVRVQLPDEVCVFGEQELRCRPLSDFE